MLWLGGALAALIVVLGIAAWVAARHFQPYVRQQVLAYLKDRYGADAGLGTFQIRVLAGAPWKLETAIVRVSGDRLSLAPLITVGQFRMDADLSSLWNKQRRVREVRLDNLVVNIPPLGQSHNAAAGAIPPSVSSVSIDRVVCRSVKLRILPADASKQPRIFEIHDLELTGAGAGRPMHFRAGLRNPTPPGDIQTAGDFGPWQRDEPGATPVSGDYQFRQADLSVFKRIAGILSSDGKYHGVLGRIEVDGRTETPDFRLTGGNPVRLTTKFHSIVDGTSGDTYLQPVDAMLASSHMVANGKVVRVAGAPRRTVKLDVVMSKGRMEDVLRLAMKGNDPLVKGQIDINTKLDLLPLSQPFAERMILDGSFDMDQAQFTGGSVQQKIDSLSRRAQGQPQNQSISDVLSSMRGDFDLRDGEVQFQDLTFQVPGAAIHLKGDYGIYSEQIDLHGIARLHATVSQTMTGWKRFVLKPVDPLFSKGGAGTRLPIKITGTRQKPEFGLDRPGKKKAD
jgi:hypothetical protein